MDPQTRQMLADALMQVQQRGPNALDPVTREALKALEDPNPDRFKQPMPLFPRPPAPTGRPNAPLPDATPRTPAAPIPPVPYYGS